MRVDRSSAVGINKLMVVFTLEKSFYTLAELKLMHLGVYSSKSQHEVHSALISKLQISSVSNTIIRFISMLNLCVSMSSEILTKRTEEEELACLHPSLPYRARNRRRRQTKRMVRLHRDAREEVVKKYAVILLYLLTL